MKKISALAGVCAVAAGLALTGCSAKTETTATTTTETTAATSTTTSAAPATAKKTIADYVAENKIIETAIKQGDPGPPSFQFPMPPGWRPAGNQRPEWAYGAIVYEKAEDPADPPFMTAIISRLSGNVEAAKIFEYAPGLLQNLPGYEQDGEIQKSTLGGFEAIQFQGSYQRENTRRYIAQKTAVIPEKDGSLVVLQLNADAPLGQDDVILEAAKVIDAETKITA
ncbi:MAG TPA: LpqN/LpqT family lipoprotein [Mycobacterium sp.]|nr:LpqN/LpqT family lipoprotein [Mycobacterium sp.]HQE16677.1 LpqN/LpqT family lipoprotein [Mycobacterium sp.]